MPVFESFQKPNIEKAIANRDVDALVKALSYLTKDDQLKKHQSADQLIRVIVLLGEIGDTRAVESLIAHTYYITQLIGAVITESEIATLCAEALANIGDERAIEPLHKQFERFGGSTNQLKRLLKCIKRFGKITPHTYGIVLSLTHETLRLIKEIGLYETLRSSKSQKEMDLLDTLGELAIEALVKLLDILAGFAPQSIGQNEWHYHTPSRMLAAYQLRKLGWQPENDADKLTFFVLARAWDELGTLNLRIRNPDDFDAVMYLLFKYMKHKDDKPFAGYLNLYHDKNVGIGAASILVKWYQDETVDDDYKIRILDERDKILALSIDFPV